MSIYIFLYACASTFDFRGIIHTCLTGLDLNYILCLPIIPTASRLYKHKTTVYLYISIYIANKVIVCSIRR